MACRLGTSTEGTQLRARMQSACLLSDMEAFKAANPGCVLADFVRWYSPRDWIEDAVVNDDGTTQQTGMPATVTVFFVLLLILLLLFDSCYLRFCDYVNVEIYC